jgi:plasmid replication initiation protein
MDYKKIVCKSNNLTKASFSMTLDQKRIVLACIAQIKDPRIELTRDDEFDITAPYFSTLFNVSLKNSYYQLKEATESLQKEVVVIHNPDINDPNLSRVVTNWFSVAKYYDGEGRVIVKFNEAIIPYISNLKNGCFTQYGINQIAKLKSVYAIRLYEILICEAWRNQDYEIEVSILKKMLGLTDKYTTTFEFKRCVILPAIASIKKNTNITELELGQRRSGRDVTHLIFKYSVKKEAEKPKINGTKPLIPLFNGHPEYAVDSEAILEDHKRLKEEPKTKPKKAIAGGDKQRITVLKQAIKGANKNESPVF